MFLIPVSCTLFSGYRTAVRTAEIRTRAQEEIELVERAPIASDDHGAATREIQEKREMAEPSGSAIPQRVPLDGR